MTDLSTSPDALILLGNIDGRLGTVQALLEDEISERRGLEGRITNMEMARAKERGYAAGIAAAVSTIMAFVTPYLKSRLFA